ncbi:DUF2784 domain-containing protein [Mycolicibacterium sp. 050158]|uniref:DUF2784 domain-containing protein n=1 Tax=Mycolicibacterium sp. 050158 TaxID=3090602 RepID=UPI00299D6F3C|nr:DUF2784 domain-containing protein [Mycolicibacterium sp. 050158]MDX1893229.1 DUF2784 domain-containing protein [Mycolicibacterium sp. 050158]
MTDFFKIVVVATAAVHFAFVGYGVFGGFLALRWPRSIWVHVPVVIWCVAIEVVDFVCPLTALERWARIHAGMAPIAPDGFLDHYVTGVWYPAEAQNLVLVLVLLVVLTSWVLVGARARRRRAVATTEVSARTESVAPLSQSHR